MRPLPPGGLAWRVALLALLAAPLAPAGSQEPARRRTLPAAVVKVISGDTVHVFVNGEVERVRYIGVASPDPGDFAQPGEPGGREAAQFNRTLVEARNVRLELDAQERDPEGRLLAYVWVGDVLVNAEIVGRGYGQVVTGSPNVRYREMLLRRQQQARAAHLGIWKGAGPPPPERPPPAGTDPKTSEARPGVAPTNSWTCPLSHPIKGDFRTYSSERCIYYEPASTAYRESRTQRCYATEDEARRDGCRQSRR